MDYSEYKTKLLLWSVCILVCSTIFNSVFVLVKFNFVYSHCKGKRVSVAEHHSMAASVNSVKSFALLRLFILHVTLGKQSWCPATTMDIHLNLPVYFISSEKIVSIFSVSKKRFKNAGPQTDEMTPLMMQCLE